MASENFRLGYGGYAAPRIVVGCRICQGKVTTIAVRQDDLKILPGLERRAETDRKTQRQDRDIGGRSAQP